MGTRHLICVKKGGKNIIAQYGQWDGYPDGQGKEILKFLSNSENIDKLKKRLKVIRFLDKDGKDKKFCKEYDKNSPEWSNEPDNRTEEQKYWFETFMTRDLGSKILNNIADSDDDEIILRDESDFVNDGLSCEYYYLIDLDKNTFGVHVGGDTLLKEYSLDKLPSEKKFLKVMEELEDDE